MYKVIGQFSPNIELTNYTEPNRFDKEFDKHTDAMDYYTTLLADMSETISDIGGEFVISLIGGVGLEDERILKRHVLSTTILVI